MCVRACVCVCVVIRGRIILAITDVVLWTNQDACPDPRDGGCKGWEAAGLPNGTFYNNNIGQCTAKQVIQSDARPTVAGTFIWSGFDYYGEARL